MKNLRYVCVQPRLLYYAWQVEVMINNFIKQGINGNNIDILVAYNKNDDTNTPEVIKMWDKLVNEYSYVRFFFYEDIRQQPIHYISSIRPNILKQHFKAHPELESEVIFYHDCDIVFTKPPNWNQFLNDNVWYLSNTNSYINYDYIVSKGQDVYDKMCSIVGINPIIPKLMNPNSGGAQYIMKNVNADYWEKVERDAERLFKEITDLNNEKVQLDRHTMPEGEARQPYHPLQIWCADMWAVLWNGWLLGNETKVVPEMDFSWATDTKNRWEETTIFHNAGVTEAGKYFYKGNYINSLPYNIEDTFSENYCSKLYFNEIKETAQKSCLI
jgi:hypothetical protein